MQIKLVNTITKWCIWPLGVEFYFPDSGTGWKYLGSNSSVHSWKKARCSRVTYISFHPTVDSGGTLVTSALLELIIPPSPNVFVLLVKISPANADDTANESVKLFSWCFSGVIRQHVSWSPERFPLWARAGSHASSDGGDTAGSMKAGVAVGEKSIPRVSVLLRQVCRPFSHLIGQRSAACLDIRG